MYSLNMPVSKIRTKVRQEFERHRYVNQLKTVDVLLFNSHQEFQVSGFFFLVLLGGRGRGGGRRRRRRDGYRRLGREKREEEKRREEKRGQEKWSEDKRSEELKHGSWDIYWTGQDRTHKDVMGKNMLTIWKCNRKP